jgi:hypothetical protein
MAIIKIIENVASITEVQEEVVKAYIRDWDTGAGAVLLSEILAKGDLLVGSAAGVIGRLPKGDDGDEIVYDSTETLGIKTQAKTSGNLSLMPSGRLTGTSGTAVTIADVTAITEIFLAHHNGNRMPLLSGSTWVYYTFDDNISIKTTDTPTGDTVNGSAVVTAVSDASQLLAGMEITGTGIPGGTTILSVDSDSQITLDANATADGSGVTLTCKVPADTNVDVFAEYVGGNVVLRFGPLWTDGTTRATALVEVDGVLCLTGDTGKRYLGTIRTTGTSGQIEDSTSKHFVWNYYNRVIRHLFANDTTDQWSYSTATWRAANGNTTDGVGRVSCVVGVAEDAIDAMCIGVVTNSTGGWDATGIGIDATDTNSAQLHGTNTTPTIFQQSVAKYNGILSAGYHYIQNIELGRGTGTSTWAGDSSVPSYLQSGLNVMMRG